MSWKDKAIEIHKRFGAPAKFAAKLILGAVLPGGSAVVDLVGDALDCADITVKDNLAVANASKKDLERVEEVLAVLANQLNPLMTQLVALEDRPKEAAQNLERAMATDANCRQALIRLDHLARGFDRIEEQNKRLLEGQGYTADMLAEMLSLIRRMVGVADYIDDLCKAGVSPADFSSFLREFQDAARAFQKGRLAEATTCFQKAAQSQPQSAAAATALAGAKSAAAFYKGSPGHVVTHPPRIKFAWIPPGKFLMGGDKHKNEKQLHLVTLSRGFYMGIYPITQAEWRAVMGYNPSKFQSDELPVEMVSWQDCQEFCQKLAMHTGNPVRLPTEAEWEYACRAGTNLDYHNGDGVESLRSVGWFNQSSPKQTQPVGQLRANAWGLYDMHGNVWEWCQDWYVRYTAANLIDPKGPDIGKYRVLRGGSWGDDFRTARSAFRGSEPPETRAEWIGFRVCYSLD